MTQLSGRVAVVTGASSGIGAAIAYQLQDAGVTVVALARRRDQIAKAVDAARLAAREREKVKDQKPPKQGLLHCFKRDGSKKETENPKPGNLHCLACDVSKEEDVIAAFKWVKENTKGVHILVNNAGVGGIHSLTGPTDANTEEWRRIIKINVLGLSICTREAINQMKEKGIEDGHIVHVSSVAGHMMPQGAGQQSMYFASKHSVRVLTEGLRKELIAAKSRIRVTEVSPGFVKTGFFEANGISKEMVGDPAHLESEDVAGAVLFAVGSPSHVQVHEIIIKPIGEQF